MDYCPARWVTWSNNSDLWVIYNNNKNNNNTTNNSDNDNNNATNNNIDFLWVNYNISLTWIKAIWGSHQILIILVNRELNVDLWK
jgi:hypothetical protein